MAIFDPAYGGFRIFVGDLGPRVSKKELERAFIQYGAIIDSWMASYPSGYAFLVFKHPQDAERAVKEMEMRKVCGRRVRVEHARPYQPFGPARAAASAVNNDLPHRYGTGPGQRARKRPGRSTNRPRSDRSPPRRRSFDSDPHREEKSSSREERWRDHNQERTRSRSSSRSSSASDRRSQSRLQKRLHSKRRDPEQGRIGPHKRSKCDAGCQTDPDLTSAPASPGTSRGSTGRTDPHVNHDASAVVKEESSRLGNRGALTGVNTDDDTPEAMLAEELSNGGDEPSGPTTAEEARAGAVLGRPPSSPGADNPAPKRGKVTTSGHRRRWRHRSVSDQSDDDATDADEIPEVRPHTKRTARTGKMDVVKRDAISMVKTDVIKTDTVCKVETDATQTDTVSTIVKDVTQTDVISKEVETDVTKTATVSKETVRQGSPTDGHNAPSDKVTSDQIANRRENLIEEAIPTAAQS